MTQVLEEVTQVTKVTKPPKVALDLPTEAEVKEKPWGRLRPEVKEKWLELLRGELRNRKTKFRLRSGDNYCIWGTLCELHAREKGWSWRENEFREYSYLGSDGLPPKEVLKWAGFKSVGVDVKLSRPDKVNRRSLMFLNDHSNLSFAEFADLIEEQL